MNPSLFARIAPLALPALLLSDATAQWTLPEVEQVAPESVSTWLNFASDIDIDGDTLVANYSMIEERVYVFTGGPGAWSEQAALVPPHGIVHAALKLSLAGDVLVVGDAGYDLTVPAAGAAFVYRRSAGTWALETTLEKTLPVEGDRLGGTVEIEGDTIAVTATYDSAGGAGSGAVYVYERVGSAWVEVQSLAGEANWARFGSSLALEGDLFVVGASGMKIGAERPGAAYVYERLAGVWTQSAMLVAPDAVDGDGFGAAVALAGDLIAVSAPLRDGPRKDTGVVYVYEREAAGWVHEATLTTLGATFEQELGRDLDFGDGLLLATTPGHDRPLKDGGGAVLFAATGGTWQTYARLSPQTPQLDAKAGAVGAIAGGQVYLGAPSYDVVGGGGGVVMRFDAPPVGLGTTTCTASPSGFDCPCSQPDGEDQGCANSTGRGASLMAVGSASVSLDSLGFLGSGLPRYAYGWLFAGDALAGRLPRGDGLLCVGGSLERLMLTEVSPHGLATLGPGLVGLGGWLAGDTRHFQLWYRDPTSPCAGSNLSSAVSLTFEP